MDSAGPDQGRFQRGQSVGNEREGVAWTASTLPTSRPAAAWWPGSLAAGGSAERLLLSSTERNHCAQQADAPPTHDLLTHTSTLHPTTAAEPE